MPRIPFKLLLASSTICFGALLCTGCIDDSYDLSKDIDMTVGLGGDGLGVRLGNTERITLDNILDVDQSVKLDANNLYYLVEDGSTNISFNVDRANTNVQNVTINTDSHVLDYDRVRWLLEQNFGTTIPEGTAISVPADFTANGEADAKEQVSLTIKDIDPVVKKLTSLQISPLRLSLHIDMKSSDNVKFGVRSIDNLRIVFPAMLKVSKPTMGTLNGNVLTIAHVDCSSSTKIAEIMVEGVNAGTSGTPNANREIVFSEDDSRISLTGSVNFGATAAFTMQPSDYADVKFDLRFNNNVGATATTPVEVLNVTGRFNPTIAPEVAPIDVAESLPDFLQDAEVALPVTNPTVRFMADMTEIPADLNFSIKLTSRKAGAADCPVELPSAGKASLHMKKKNTIYFFQGNAPYDPEKPGLISEAATQKYQTANLSSLINPLPDDIAVDLKNDRVKLNQDKDYTIELGHSYSAQADYAVFVPFEFSNGLTIVYNDSTNSMNSDLKDYAAEGVRVSAKVENTIPLNLVGTIRAVDINGNEMPGVRFNEVTIQAGNGGETPVMSDLVLEAKLDDPQDLKRVDRFLFNVHAASGETTTPHSLVSTQYLRLTDMRVRLTGRIIADFN